MIIVVLLDLINHEPKATVQGAGWSDCLCSVGCTFVYACFAVLFVYMCLFPFICNGWQQNILLNHTFIFCAHQ